MAQETHYDAFISYRHSPLDQKIASALHRKLENYKLPGPIAKKIGKRKLERVFRDTTELSVSSELSEAINQALIHSDYLIAICSPRYTESGWCMKEVEVFLKLRGKDHILLVLIEGDPDDSFPEILRYEEVVKKNENGEEVTVREFREPLAAECRGKTPRELRNAVNDTSLRLLSAIFGIKYDDLKQRQREAEIKQRALITSAVILVLLLIISQSMFFLFRLQKQNRIIEEKLADSTASGSATLLREGRTMDAVYAARSVLPEEESKGYNANAFRALADATGVYTIPGEYRSNRILSFPAPVLRVLFSADGQSVVGLDYNDNTAYVLDTSDSSVILTHRGLSYGNYNVSFDGKNGILFADEDKITYCNREDGTEHELIPETGLLYSPEDFSVTLAVTGKSVYAISEGKILYEKEYGSMVRGRNGDFDVPSGLFAGDNVSDLVLSPDNRYASALFETYDENYNVTCGVICFDTFTGDTLYCNIFDSLLVCACYDGESLFVLESRYEQVTPESILHKIDVRTDNPVQSVSFDGEYFYGFYPTEDRYLLYNTTHIVLLDSSLNILFSFGIEENIVVPFSYEGTPAVFLTNGKMYLWSEEMSLFYEASDFGRNDNANLKCYYVNGMIYILKFNSDFITVYEKYRSPYLTEISDPGGESAPGEYDSGYEMFEEGNDGENGKKKELYSLIFPGQTPGDSEIVIASDDNRFIAIQNTDRKVSVYDTETRKCVFDTYSMEEEILNFYYVEPDRVYVLYDYYGISLFTPEFNYISRIDNVSAYGKSTQNGHLILGDAEGEYELTVATYDEVIQIADEMLGDYRPEEKIREKYGLK